MRICEETKNIKITFLRFHSHRCCAVRDGTAHLLTLLVNKMGLTKVMSSKSFITAVNKMCLDTSPTTRWVSFSCEHPYSSTEAKTHYDVICSIFSKEINFCHGDWNQRTRVRYILREHFFAFVPIYFQVTSYCTGSVFLFSLQSVF